MELKAPSSLDRQSYEAAEGYPMTYKTGSIGEFMKSTKHIIADPKAADGTPKRWFDSDKTAEKALGTKPRRRLW